MTSPSSELHHLSPGDPSVTGKHNVFPFQSRHHDFGAIPLIFWENQKGVLLYLDQQKVSQRHAGFYGVNLHLRVTVNVNKVNNAAELNMLVTV